MPRLNGRRTTCAPCSAATSAVRSAEPSETTTTSRPGSNARSSSITRPMLRSSLYAGTIAIRRNASADTRFLAKSEQLEQLPCAVAIRVLVEDAFARAAPHLLGLRRVPEQAAVRLHCLVGVIDDNQLRAG